MGKNHRDTTIVRAAIHPGIGVARVGDAQSEFIIGPEVTAPQKRPASYYRDDSGAMKREAARFRIYGYNAAGDVVREITCEDADIEWTAHLANRKADWYRFITAMDIPETKDLTLIQRNAKIKNRESLVIDPGPRSISGVNQSGKKKYAFDSGQFKKEKVYLGELQTDDAGRLIVLGGRGRSESPGGKPPFDPKDPDSFNNANDWFDDVADGSVDASVSIGGKTIPVEGAWVIVSPPNYAPDVIGWRTMYDLMCDTYVANGWMPVPQETSFTQDVLPQLRRLSNLQWVNKGFYSMFGRGNPMDFEDSDLLSRLNQKPAADGTDPWGELRNNLLNAFRPFQPIVNEPRLWPWIYGDDFGGGLFADSPNTMLALPSIQQLHLQRWARGDFIDDWEPTASEPTHLDQVPVAEQPAMLDQAAMHYCLADAFHPGCEMTWPMRHATLYSAPFRIRRRVGAESDYGKTLDQRTTLAPDGPLHGQSPGDITRWMGLPWQGDTAYCRAGYDTDFDMFLPTFWPARVPNNVLTEDDYKIVKDETLPRSERITAYTRRASWYRFVDEAPTIPKRMERMIAIFGAQGIVEARPGIKDDPVFPATLYVETLGPELQKSARKMMKAMKVARTLRAQSFHESVWSGDEDHRRAAQALRARRTHKE